MKVNRHVNRSTIQSIDWNAWINEYMNSSEKQQSMINKYTQRKVDTLMNRKLDNYAVHLLSLSVYYVFIMSILCVYYVYIMYILCIWYTLCIYYVFNMYIILMYILCMYTSESCRSYAFDIFSQLKIDMLFALLPSGLPLSSLLKLPIILQRDPTKNIQAKFLFLDDQGEKRKNQNPTGFC